MHYNLRITSAPAVEPVSTSEAKLHCRVDYDADDTLFAAWITAAREYAETYQRRALITQMLEMSLPAFPCGEIVLPRPPLQSVTSIAYVDANGDSQTLNSSLYQVDTRGIVGRVKPAYGQVWPSTRCETYNAVTITYVAGYGDAATAVPRATVAAIKLLVGHLNENREMVITGTIIGKVPFSIENLLNPNRVLEAL